MENQDEKVVDLKNEPTSCYQTKLSANEINLLYSMMQLRISKGCSTKETSFLMGYVDDPIGKLEQLTNEGIDFVTTFQMFQAFEEGSLKGLITANESYGDGSFHCQMLTADQGNIREHSFFMTYHDGKEKLVFKLFEQQPDYVQHPIEEEDTQNETRAILQVIFDGTIFYEPQAPLDIYRRCRLMTGLEMRPRHLMQALSEIMAKRGNPKMVQRKSRRDGKITFEKIIK